MRFLRSIRNVLIPDGTRTNAPATQVEGSGTTVGGPPPAIKLWEVIPKATNTRNKTDFFIIFRTITPAQRLRYSQWFNFGCAFFYSIRVHLFKLQRCLCLLRPYHVCAHKCDAPTSLLQLHFSLTSTVNHKNMLSAMLFWDMYSHF
jgi:hypothetical protein